MRIRPLTSYGGADFAIDGRGRVHIVTANLEDGWPHPPWDDASVYTSTRGRATAWRRDVLLGGGAPSVATGGRGVWIMYAAYACGPGQYADPTGIAVSHSPDHGSSWRGPHCLTWGRGAPVSLAASRRAVYAVGSQRHRDVTVWVSRDRGSTFARTMLVRTPRMGCCAGGARVAATGMHAAVAWPSRGQVKVRISHDAGRTWSTAETLPLDRLDGAAGRGARLVFWGGAPGATTLVTWTPRDGWSSQVLPDAAWAGAEPPSDDYGGSLLVALGPERELAVLGSGAACTYDEDTDVTTGSSTLVRSADNGRTWSDPETVAGCPSPYGAQMLIDPDGRPYVLQEDEDWGYDLVIGPRTRQRA